MVKPRSVFTQIVWFSWWTLGLFMTAWMARWVWLVPFDLKYLENLFERSQWRIPVSQYIIGDNELYQVAGVRIIRDSDFYTTNPEVPPVGKYIYGVAAIWLHHPIWASFALYAVALVLFWFCTKPLPLTARKFAIGWWIWSSLVSLQLSQTMLDLPQLVFFLLHIVSLYHWQSAQTRSSQVRWWIIVTLSLGLFSATKIGLFSPLIFMADAWLAWQKMGKKSWLWLSGLATGTGFTYLFTYIHYFAQASIFDWITAQKWMVHFYASSHVKAIPGMAIITALTGWFRGWWSTQGWQPIKEWNSIWSFGVIAGGISLRELWLAKKKHLPIDSWWGYLTVLFTLLLLGNCFIPFWPRYFLLLWPLAVLFTLKKTLLHSKWWIVISVVVVGQWWFALSPAPDERLAFSLQTWRNAHWSELYEFQSPQTRYLESRESYRARFPWTGVKPARFDWPAWIFPWHKSIPVTAVYPTQSRLPDYHFRAVRIGSQWFIEPDTLPWVHW